MTDYIKNDPLNGLKPSSRLIKPHIASDDTSCKCRSLLSEDDFMGGIGEVFVDNGKLIQDGGNDCPPLDQAKANALLIYDAFNTYWDTKMAPSQLNEALKEERKMSLMTEEKYEKLMKAAEAMAKALYATREL